MTIKWKQRYLELAKHVSSWSKDPSTQVGCVAIGNKGQVLSQGYNGFPRGIDDNESRLSHRPTKYSCTVHAEMNVIYNASYSGVSLCDSTFFVYGLPVCSECAKGIIQVGAKHVVMRHQEIPDTWKTSWDFSQSFLKEAGITWEFIKYE